MNSVTLNSLICLIFFILFTKGIICQTTEQPLLCLSSGSALNQIRSPLQSTPDITSITYVHPLNIEGNHTRIVADRKPLIFPISALGANFNPQNTICIHPVKIFARLELEKIFGFSFKH